MTIQFPKRTLVAIMAAGIGIAGISTAPAKADSGFVRLLEQLAKNPRKGYYDHNPYRKHHDLFRRHNQHLHQGEARREYNPYEREVRGLYVPGYNIRGVLDNVYSGHRH